MYKILRLPEVRKMTGLARSTIYNRMAQGAFPTQISLGPQAVGWLETDIEKWIQERIAQSQVMTK